MTETRKSVCIVVLGDIGRSPRMQYHALSLGENKYKVDVVGYGETQPSDELKAQPLVSYHYLPAYPSIPCPRLLNYMFKTLWQIATLVFMFIIIRRPNVVLVQNPPAVPSLLVCWLYALVARARLIIDWHNYAYTIMALNVGSENLLVKITKKVESFIGRRASDNFCVTNAMKNDLEKHWNIRAVTLYDRPPEIFHAITLKEKHELLLRLGRQYTQLLGKESTNTAFTTTDSSGNIQLKPDRPGLLISSTSWTEDEDFSLLFSALREYEEHLENGNVRKLPKLICVITGKGPLKEYYKSKIAESSWKHVEVITPWLESKDYPTLLASSDLGVCLHTSSSGLDLPMKVVDMFGCGLPVCAYDFNCLSELVMHGENGYTFKDTKGLSEQIQKWFECFPNNKTQNAVAEKFKLNLQTFQSLRWRENWKKTALHLFK